MSLFAACLGDVYPALYAHSTNDSLGLLTAIKIKLRCRLLSELSRLQYSMGASSSADMIGSYSSLFFLFPMYVSHIRVWRKLNNTYPHFTLKCIERILEEYRSSQVFYKLFSKFSSLSNDKNEKNTIIVKSPFLSCF